MAPPHPPQEPEPASTFIPVSKHAPYLQPELSHLTAKVNGTINKGPKILPNVLHYIGNTPMIRLNRIPASMGIKCEVLVKCEYFNAGGSHKDRIAKKMIEQAERDGRLKPGYTIIEPTSGNTGIGVAMVAAVKGYECILVMPEKMSAEKNDTMHALGAKIYRTPKCLPGAPESHTAVAERLHKEIPNSIILDQYGNEANPRTHYEQTAEEILDQCDGKLDMIVIGAGTGGAITGIGRKMKEKCKECIVVGVDPEGSIMALPDEINKSSTSFWEIEGIGHDWIPNVLDRSVIDRWYKCTDKASLQMARRVIKEEGLLVGGSCGSAISSALEAIKDADLSEDQRCVILLPDSIRNYMTKFLSDTWMLERGFIPDPQCTQEYSWWNGTVSDLDLTPVVTLLPTASIKSAVDLMKSNGVQQLPVVSADGEIKGAVTLNTLMAKMLANKITPDQPVKEVLHTQIKRVTPETKLGKLSYILQTSQFAFVVSPSAPEVVTGVISHIDLLNYAAHQ